MAYTDLVSITIVTYNSGRFIKRCLQSVLAQGYRYKEVVVIDNASTDGTVAILEQFEDRCRVVFNDKNVGFAAAQNQAINLARGEWVLALNPDVLLTPYFIEALLEAGHVDPKVGTACGKLLTMRASFSLPDEPLVDSTGIYFTPMLRHLDRGSQEIDNGHYVNHEYVFGATAAAALYRREMIEDISLNGEFFDATFLHTARMPTLPGALSSWAGAVSRFPRRAVSCPNGAPGKPPGTATAHQHASVKDRFLMRMGKT